MPRVILTGGRGGLAQEASRGKNISVWPRDHSWDILAKDEAAFCPCPRSLSETKLKSFALLLLAA